MFEFKHIDKHVQKSLYRRIDALNRNGNFDILEPIGGVDDPMNFLTKSCWARVTSAVYGKNADGTKNDTPFRLSSAFKNGQPLNRPLTSEVSLYTDDPNATFRPHSGITGISTNFKTKYGVQEVTINWKFYDINKFHEYETALLKHGRIVLVEFGWAENRKINLEPEIVTDEEEFLKTFKATNKKIKDAGGDYYCAMGKITSFSYDINEQGGFDCTTTLTSLGSDIFSSTIDENPNSKIKEIQESNRKELEDAYKNSNFYFEKFMENLDVNIALAQEEGEAGVYHNGEQGYCNWAWFEDIVLTTFFGWTTEKFIETDAPVPDGKQGPPNREITKFDDGQSVAQVLSRNLKYDVDGDGKIDKTIIEDSLCRFGEFTYTISKHAILPGRIPGVLNVGADNTINGSFGGVDIGDQLWFKLGGTDAYSDYVNLFQDFKQIDTLFPPFKHPTKDKGIIRNFVFSSDYLKQYFSSVSNLDSALSSFWGAVSSLYGGYWQFDLVNDFNNTGKIGVIDRYETEQRVGEINPEVRDDYTTDKARDIVFSEKGVDTFVFSNYGRNSLFSDFNVSVNLSSQMATMAMYHSNKNIKTKASSTTNKPEMKGVQALGELQNEAIRAVQQGEDITPYEDLLLHDITHPFQKGLIKKYKNTGGSFAETQAGETTLEKVNSDMTFHYGDKNFTELSSELTSIRASEEEALEIEQPFDGLTSFDFNNPQKNGLIWNTNGDMISSYERTLLYFMNKTLISDSEVDPLVPIEISFSMPGIGGIDLFDVFGVDYLPETYKKYSLFQVKAQQHQLDSTGWKTTITGLMRVDMDKLVKAKGKIIEPDIKEPTGQDQIDFIDFTIKSEAEDKKTNNDAENSE